MPSSPSINLHTVNFAKAVAVAAVVLLHSLSLLPDSIYTSSSNWFFVALNQAARFSVPLFLALSGYGLAKKYSPGLPSSLNFLLGRFRKLLPLYLLWSLILLTLLSFQPWHQSPSYNLWQDLVFGRTDYHLYFVPLLLQLYLLFTFLSRHQTPRRLLALVLASAALQLLWFSFIRLSSLEPHNPLNRYLLDDQFQYRLLPNWLFYFLLGTLLAHLHLDRLRSHHLAAPLLLAVVTASLIWSILDARHLIASTQNLVYATSFIRLPVFLYATGFILFFFLFGHRLSSLPDLLTRPAVAIGRHSYLVYLSHTLLLRILEETFSSTPHPQILTLAGLMFLAGTALSHRLSPAA